MAKSANFKHYLFEVSQSRSVRILVYAELSSLLNRSNVPMVPGDGKSVSFKGITYERK